MQNSPHRLPLLDSCELPLLSYHANVRGAVGNVELEITARATDTGLALTVKDNGRWHTPPPSARGQRGHGSRLMRALVDTVTITPTPQGTTVEMRKELHP